MSSLLVRRFLVLSILLLVTGIGVHFALHGSAGWFLWSVTRTAKLEPITDTPAAETTATSFAAESKERGEAGTSKVAALKKVSLFDGKSLGKWEPVEFGGEGETFVNEKGHLEFGSGAIMTGVRWKEEPPATGNYEIALEAMKLDGNDFFVALTFPVRDNFASLIVGGWGGGIVGISSIDDLDASENETMNIEGFENDRWYKIRLRVAGDKLEAWIDDKQLIDADIRDKKVGMRPGDIELCVPLGLACYTGVRAQYRNLIWTPLPAPTTETESGAENPTGDAPSEGQNAAPGSPSSD